MSLERLDFDTTVLGIPVAKITGLETTLDVVKNLLSDAKRQDISLVHWACSAKCVTGSVEEFFSAFPAESRSVNTKVIYHACVNRSLISALRARRGVSGVEVSDFQGTEPTEGLVSLGIMAGQHSRFATDVKLSAGQCQDMFSKWVLNSVNKQVADVVFVATVKRDGVEHLAGMITVRLNQSASTIGLLAVHRDFRQKGVGVALVAQAFAWSTSRGIHDITVATQSLNAPACALYTSCGFEVHETHHDIHFWLGTDRRDDLVDHDIPNCKPFLGTKELENLQALFASRDIRTHSTYGVACQELLQSELHAHRMLLVGSGTQALELCSLLLQAQAGEGSDYEIIMPSYTFVSTANAFVIHGAKPVFVDIRPDTQNIDETKIEAAIKLGVTRAICVVHYAGVPCEMDEIMRIANKHHLLVIEDNAHGIFSTYKGKHLGTIGDLGAFSFHYTKNFVCGEGGAVAVNNTKLISQAMIAYEKGTNRFDFLQGRISKYAWVAKGGSFPMSEIAAAVLHAQLSMRNDIQTSRMRTWGKYHEQLEELELAGRLVRPAVPAGCTHNAHIYYIRVPAKCDFDTVARVAKQSKVSIFTHYEPLHNSTGGQRLGRVGGECTEAERCASQLYRLPMWVGLTDQDIARVVDAIFEALGEHPKKKARVQH